jgi:hypothetical protein
MTRHLRIAQAALLPDELVVGVGNATAPENFYHFPTVNLTPQKRRPEAQAAGAA